MANGADLPPEIILQGFLKPGESQVRLLVRVPLVLLSSFGLPKRGPGYLDLARMNDKLKEAAAASGQQIELFADGNPLSPVIRGAQISLLSDHSFANYSAALSHVEGPPLPSDTELFWNQGFFDTELDYPLASPNPRLSLRVNVAPEMGARVRLRLEYLAGRRACQDLRNPWRHGSHPARSTLVRDRLALCEGRLRRCICLRSIRLPRLPRGAVPPISRRPGGCGDPCRHAGRDIGGGRAGSARGRRSPMASRALRHGSRHDACAPRHRQSRRAEPARSLVRRRRHRRSRRVRRRPSPGRRRAIRGDPHVVSDAFFNLGIALGEFVSLVIALAALRLLFASVLGPLLGVVVLSAVLGHLGWQWMLDGGHEFVHQLGHAAAAGVSSAMRVVALWMVPALVAGAAGYFLPRRFDGGPAPTLLGALHARAGDEKSAR